MRALKALDTLNCSFLCIGERPISQYGLRKIPDLLDLFVCTSTKVSGNHAVTANIVNLFDHVPVPLTYSSKICTFENEKLLYRSILNSFDDRKSD